MVNSRRGRPRGVAGARVALLHVAQRHLELGDLAERSSREIAEEADVSHSLVNYHFGSRDGLIAAAVSLRLAPHSVVEASRDAEGVIDLRALLASFVAVWEDDLLRAPLLDAARSAVAGEHGSQAFADYLQHSVVEALVGSLGIRRARSVAIVIVGTVFARYVLRLPSLAEPSRDELVDMLLRLTGEAR